MSEPNLALDIATTAAKAVTTLAIQASAPRWKYALTKLRPAPATLRKSTAWDEFTAARDNAVVLSKYLASRSCRSLLELYTFLEATERDNHWQAEKLRLSTCFAEEFSARIKIGEKSAKELGVALWTELTDTIKLQIAELRESDLLLKNDIAYIARLGKRSNKRTEPSVIERSVSRRAEISGDTERVDRIYATIRVIADAIGQRFSKHSMPHSRRDYRASLGDLYVSRTMIPTNMATKYAIVDGLLDVADVEVALSDTDDSHALAEEDMIDRRFVVVGNPGAGKSTFTRHHLYQTASGENSYDVAPMIIELKDYPNPENSYITVLAERLRVLTQAEIAARTVTDILTLGLATVVFDGLDEIIHLDSRRATVDSIEAFCRRYPLVRVIVTSRQEGYFGARLDPATFPVYYLPDFNPSQVSLYTSRWFQLTAEPGYDDPVGKAEHFLRDSIHVRDLRSNPLMLSLLCLLYEWEGYIPANRPAVYEQCAELLFERWDRVRGVATSFRPSAHVRYLVQELASHFISRSHTQGGEGEHRLLQLIARYFEANILPFDDRSPITWAQDFLDYCAGRAWILTKVGISDFGERIFGFTHRTFMEYFAACHLVRQCDDAAGLVDKLEFYLSSGIGDTLPQISIQQFDSRRVHGIDDCLKLLISAESQLTNERHVRRLAFALRSLEFLRPSPLALSEIFTTTLREFGRTLDVAWFNLSMNSPYRKEFTQQCAKSVDSNDKAVRLGSSVANILTSSEPPIVALQEEDDMAEILRSRIHNSRGLVPFSPEIFDEMRKRKLL